MRRSALPGYPFEIATMRPALRSPPVELVLERSRWETYAQGCAKVRAVVHP